jgi:hypothetical protein
MRDERSAAEPFERFVDAASHYSRLGHETITPRVRNIDSIATSLARYKIEIQPSTRGMGVFLRDRAVGCAEAPLRGSSPFGRPSLTRMFAAAVARADPLATGCHHVQ